MLFSRWDLKLLDCMLGIVFEILMHLFVWHSDSYLNMVVLTLANGTFCICYQKMETPYTIDRRSPVKRSKKSPGPVWFWIEFLSNLSQCVNSFCCFFLIGKILFWACILFKTVNTKALKWYKLISFISWKHITNWNSFLPRIFDIFDAFWSK